MISAEVVCDSVSHTGKRMTTLKLRYPKFIHGELMTHRQFSRNASSSRAIPTRKLIEEVTLDALRAEPVWWGKNQAGMQAAEELSDTIPRATEHYEQRRSDRQLAMDQWRDAALSAAHHAEQLLAIGAHKQIVNRVLEPFSHINVVVTATEFDNFFGLRLHKDAQPEMRTLAERMYEVMQASSPHPVTPGHWHLPFITDEDFIYWRDMPWKFDDDPVRVSVARCARVSYESFETGKRSTIDEDLALFARLRTSGHWSPFEHQAAPDSKDVMFINRDAIWLRPELHGNFDGWMQLRKMLPNEAVAPMPEGY